MAQTTDEMADRDVTSRRQILRRIGLGAASVYAAPELLSLMGAAKASSRGSGRLPRRRNRSVSFSRPSR